MSVRREIRLDLTNAVIVSKDKHEIIHNGVHQRCPHCGTSLLHNRDTFPIWNVGSIGQWQCCKCRQKYNTLTLPVPKDTPPEVFYERIRTMLEGADAPSIASIKSDTEDIRRRLTCSTG